MDKPTFLGRMQSGWNAFLNKEPPDEQHNFQVHSHYSRPDRKRPSYIYDNTIVSSIVNRIAVDAASATFEHIRTDDNSNFSEVIFSELNNVLNVEANIDQSGSAFILDLVTSMLDEGCVACVPVDTRSNPEYGVGGYDILTMRVGKIVRWYPSRIDVELYNDRTGDRETINVSKLSTAIIENPFYNIMNTPNSTLKRLQRRLSLLDISDESASDDNLNLIIQLPYTLRSPTKQKQAQERLNQIVDQLKNSPYGIAYTDGTEKIIQLNRSIDSNLIEKIKYLTEKLHDQLGITPEVLNMTANEQTMVNYYRRVVTPILDAIKSEFSRKFLTKTARTQNQTVWWYSEPFGFTTTTTLAEISDKLIRNEVLTSNEMRGVIGFKPKDDPRADELRNPNMPDSFPMDDEYDTEEADHLVDLPVI